MINVYMFLVGFVLIVMFVFALLVNVPKLISWGSEKHTFSTQHVWLEIVQGPRRKPINFFWASVTLLGSLVVLYISVSSYYGRHFFSFISSEFVVPFLPQGVILTFYGIAGLFLSLYLCLLIFWNVGGGYNVFDKRGKMVWFFRYGFPGKYRRFSLRVCMEDIQSVILEIDPIDPNKKHVVYLSTREHGILPLTAVDYYDDSNVLQKAWDLSRFLSVPMEYTLDS